jgi:fructose-bisphosphate aldolase, class I
LTTDLRSCALELVGDRRGILAADESPRTMSTRLEKAGVEPTEENRRAYREMLVTAPDLSDGVSGVILCEETLRQKLADGRTFPEACKDLGIQAGIKVDTGVKPLAGGAPGEVVTEGLDGLDARVAEFVALGATFAKWRAVIEISEAGPTEWSLKASAWGLARYAKACQVGGLVPIVEPEVLMDGAHTQQACADTTARALTVVFNALADAGVDLAGIVLKPNMVVAGLKCPEQPGPDEVAAATVETLSKAVPAEVAGIAFLSGGQSAETATLNLKAMQELDAPWPLTFSFGRALVSPALAEWVGDPGKVAAGQAALLHHVRANSSILRGLPPSRVAGS